MHIPGGSASIRSIIGTKQPPVAYRSQRHGARHHGNNLDHHHRLRRRCDCKIRYGSNEPSGFILTTILGIVGAFVASFLGQALGWYQPGEGAGLIGAVVGAIIVLFIWGAIARRRT